MRWSELAGAGRRNGWLGTPDTLLWHAGDWARIWRSAKHTGMCCDREFTGKVFANGCVLCCIAQFLCTGVPDSAYGIQWQYTQMSL